MVAGYRTAVLDRLLPPPLGRRTVPTRNADSPGLALQEFNGEPVQSGARKYLREARRRMVASVVVSHEVKADMKSAADQCSESESILTSGD